MCVRVIGHGIIRETGTILYFRKGREKDIKGIDKAKMSLFRGIGKPIRKRGEKSSKGLGSRISITTGRVV